jgi:hypothetical protein
MAFNCIFPTRGPRKSTTSAACCRTILQPWWPADWQPYAEHMMEVLSAQADFVNRAGAGHFSPRPAWRPCTKFEQRGERLGHGVWDLIFEKI